MKYRSDLRPSPIAGRWYSDDPQKLHLSIKQYIDGAKLPDVKGQIVAIIVPHAGHVYSGPVAGYAFAAIQNLAPDLVAIISPMHQAYYQPLLTSAHAGYYTPLGSVMIDVDAVDQLDRQLEADLGFGLTGVANDTEHSLEIELPFLQIALKNKFNLLPVMVRDQSMKVSQVLGISLARVLKGKKALLVGSTDLSHFYPQQTAERFDHEMIRQLEAFSPEGMFAADDDGKGFACGLPAVAAVLWAARELGADQVKVLRYATSGDITGDFSSVVGYAAAIVVKNQ
jgi:AmmeMemoRadiSam system protein B